MVKALLYGIDVLVVVCILGTWTQLLMGVMRNFSEKPQSQTKTLLQVMASGLTNDTALPAPCQG